MKFSNPRQKLLHEIKATWRINLEIFSGFSEWWDEGEVTHTTVQEMAEEFVLMDTDDHTSTVASYAMAFMSEVNWHEIADHLNAEMEVASAE